MVNKNEQCPTSDVRYIYIYIRLILKESGKIKLMVRENYSYH